MENFYERLSARAQESPDRVALLVCDTDGNIKQEVSHAQLLSEITRAASYLERLGLGVGDRVALEMPPSAELLALSWAAWASGVVTVPLDTKRDTEEMRAFKVQTTGAKITLAKKEWDDSGTFNAWMPDMTHEALVLFTSGTTSHPKGARLTLENLVVNAESIGQWLHITPDDRFLVVLPLHHINSTTFCLSALLSGASVAISPGYSNSHFFMQAAGSQATFTSIVPSIVFDQLSREKEFAHVKDTLKLTRIQLGSAPVISSDALAFIEKFSIPLYQGYGQTETALRATGVPMDLPEPLYKKCVEENSIGVPMAWADVEIADAQGMILSEGEEGELVVTGTAVMTGYIGGEPAFRDGYFLTGDIGYWKNIDGRRFFYLKGRAKEIIIKGGVNISPVAVEDALKKISADIDQVYVVGAPDERYGEEIVAAIVWKKDTDNARALRRLKLSLVFGDARLSAYETPKYFTTISAEALPMTSTGKVQRSVLKKNLDTLEPISTLFTTDEYRFEILSAHSPLFEESHALYNHCWQPLIKDVRTYEKYMREYITLAGIDAQNKIAGQIAFSHSDGKLTCVSICSANFKPKPIPDVSAMPTVEEVRTYLLDGHDPVMNFHNKLGAELVDVTAHGRPEDKSALGFTMLLHYPPLTASSITAGVPASQQLIEAVRILASDMGTDVYAISRPGGLAMYLSRMK